MDGEKLNYILKTVSNVYYFYNGFPTGSKLNIDIILNSNFGKIIKSIVDDFDIKDNGNIIIDKDTNVDDLVERAEEFGMIIPDNYITPLQVATYIQDYGQYYTNYVNNILNETPPDIMQDEEVDNITYSSLLYKGLKKLHSLRIDPYSVLKMDYLLSDEEIYDLTNVERVDNRVELLESVENKYFNKDRYYVNFTLDNVIITYKDNNYTLDNIDDMPLPTNSYHIFNLLLLLDDDKVESIYGFNPEDKIKDIMKELFNYVFDKKETMIKKSKYIFTAFKGLKKRK